MDNVLPFITRLAERGDWSSGERARLMSMAAHMAGGADDLDVAFGRTDEGDPWCVVVDGAGDVLVHVARVGGRFIVHQALGDLWEEGTDLISVLRAYLGPAWAGDAPEDVVVHLDPQARKSGQGFTALIIATAFYYATSAASDPEVRTAPLTHDDNGGDGAVRQTASQLIDALAAPEARHETHAALVPQAAPPSEAPPIQVAHAHAAEAAPPAVELAAATAAIEVAAASLPAPEQPRHMQVAKLDLAMLMPAHSERIVGTEGADVLTGGPGASLILAGGGDDRLDGGGAPKGEVDVLDGGAGNDTLVMASNTVARGGSGADTFLVSKPTAPQPDAASNQLGIVLDLNTAEGDTIKSTHGADVKVVASAPTADVLINVRNLPGLASLAPAPGEQLTIDIDGDGTADGVLLVVHTGGQIVYSLAPVEKDEPTAPSETSGHAGDAGLVGAPAHTDANLL